MSCLQTDDLITTAGSSFGRIAHARKGVPPYVVTKMGSCVRQLTSEPCSRLWCNDSLLVLNNLHILRKMNILNFLNILNLTPVHHAMHVLDEH